MATIPWDIRELSRVPVHAGLLAHEGASLVLIMLVKVAL